MFRFKAYTIYYPLVSFIFNMVDNGGNMARKGLRRTTLSRYNEIDAGNELCIPLKLFLSV